MRSSGDDQDLASPALSKHLLAPAVVDETARIVAWHNEVAALAQERLSQAAGTELLARWHAGLPRVYSAGVLPHQVVDDLLHAEEVLADPDREVPVVDLHSSTSDDMPGKEVRDTATWRLRLYRPEPATLSRVLPFAADLGVEVTDERPYVLRREDDRCVWLYDIGLRPPATPGEGHAGHLDPKAARELFGNAFAAAWSAQVDSDALSRLVLVAGLTWQQVAVVRAFVRYLRQTGLPHTPEYVAHTLAEHPAAARLIVALFEARTMPVRLGGPTERSRGVAAIRAEVEAIVDAVAGRDTDRILRALWSVVEAVLRTNAHRRDAGGHMPDPLSFKLDPSRVHGMPSPCPTFEIWVHGPRIEGVHLRFGAVARGGLRWSGRLEDFRTEVLSLVKAQVVKNAVIVPTGAKGGFVAKHLPDPDVDRDAWWAEGVACYRRFISGILDVTDNLRIDGDQRVIVPPLDVVRHDGDDPYLVVAADKGTATFSDIANEIAAERDFWLGDAFASGGSNGFDHKAMGITARGAWESVRRHFRELGTDPQTTDVTVVGIGDMSGDVFGNGMLLSEHIRLVAAFDHRHIFLDPNPDAAASYGERHRLFALGRSSWLDYDPNLISAGGGVHPRTAKSVPISPEVAQRLMLPTGTERLGPDDLIRAILAAPVDLLWNGGIGTYVKATNEQDLEVGDKANDAVRVVASELRVRVVGEGGNLGLTQRGRVEAASRGVRLNNDAIDNSAGVDCSDHEVNIKVAMDQAVADGTISREERNATLLEMNADVAALVLENNRSQNEILSDEGFLAPEGLPAHRRMIDTLVSSGQLDRQLEALPGDAELDRRAREGLGLTVPELSVLLSHAKIALAGALTSSDLPDEGWVAPLFRRYFPAVLREHHASQLDEHPLRHEIAATVLVNAVVNGGGITMVHRACEETGRQPADVVRAAAAVAAIFDLRGLAADVRRLDGQVPAAVQTAMRQEQRRLIDRATRWFLHSRTGTIDVEAEVERFAPAVARLAPHVPELLVGQDRDYVEALAATYSDHGAPADAALRTARSLYAYALLDIVELAESADREVDEVAKIWFALSQRYRFDVLLTLVSALSRSGTWQVHARSALRFDLYDVHRQFTASVLAVSPTPLAEEPDVERTIGDWERQHPAAVARAVDTLDQVENASSVDLAVLTVALRNLRHVIDHA